MSLNIKQLVEQTGDAEYTVIMQGIGAEYSEVFTKTNKVFPAYRSIIDVLKDIKDTTVEVETNFEKLTQEINMIPNVSNQGHLQHLPDVIARNNIDFTITYRK